LFVEMLNRLIVPINRDLRFTSIELLNCVTVQEVKSLSTPTIHHLSLIT